MWGTQQRGGGHGWRRGSRRLTGRQRDKAEYGRRGETDCIRACPTGGKDSGGPDVVGGRASDDVLPKVWRVAGGQGSASRLDRAHDVRACDNWVRDYPVVDPLV